MGVLPDSVASVQAHLRASAEVKQNAADKCAEAVVHAAEQIAEALRRGGKILICGNGGSAADCQHMAAEFVCQLSTEFARPGIAAIALTTDSSFLTAYANDIGFEGVFARQVDALGSPGDVLIGISTSGQSRNVVLAVERARARGLYVVVLCGTAGVLPTLADTAIQVPSQSTQHIQESHLAIEHIICHLVEQELYGHARVGAQSS